MCPEESDDVIGSHTLYLVPRKTARNECQSCRGGRVCVARILFSCHVFACSLAPSIVSCLTSCLMPNVRAMHSPRPGAFSPNLTPIDESSPLVLNGPADRAMRMRREHLNTDCKHLVPYDYPTIIIGKFHGFHDARSPRSGSWFYRTFWSTRRRKGFSILGLICCSVLIAASGLWFLFPPRITL